MNNKRPPMLTDKQLEAICSSGRVFNDEIRMVGAMRVRNEYESAIDRHDLFTNEQVAEIMGELIRSFDGVVDPYAVSRIHEVCSKNNIII